MKSTPDTETIETVYRLLRLTRRSEEEIQRLLHCRYKTPRRPLQNQPFDLRQEEGIDTSRLI